MNISDSFPAKEIIIMKKEKMMLLTVCAVLCAFALITAGITGCSKDKKDAKDNKGTVTQVSEDNEGQRTMDVTVYAYCPCGKCNTEKWTGMLSTGKRMKTLLSKGEHICAADPSVIPLGSTVNFKGKDYIVADTGRKIKGNTINILLENHRAVNAFGVKKDQTITVTGR